MKLQRSHWIAIAGQVSAFSMLIATLGTWQAAQSPMFAAAALAWLGSLILALCGEPIQGRKVLTPAEREEARQRLIAAKRAKNL